MSLCPCCSGMPAEMCCEPFLSGVKQAQTAEQLMRSRYTAFVRQRADYLYITSSPELRERTSVEEITQSFNGVIWEGLEITFLSRGFPNDTEGEVAFEAHYRIGQQQHVLLEHSLFVRENGNWRYHARENAPAAVT